MLDVDTSRSLGVQDTDDLAVVCFVHARNAAAGKNFTRQPSQNSHDNGLDIVSVPRV